MSKYFIIINPVAGGKKSASVIPQIEATLKQHKIDFSIQFTSKQGDANSFAKNAIEQGYDFVIAAGGDGTINEVATALIHSKTALGIIPLGSGNGLARHLKIPMDVIGACEYFIQATAQPMDVISINNYFSFNVSGFGFDALIAHRFQHAKQRGLFGYIKTIVKELFSYKELAIETSVNNIITKNNVFICAIANSSQFGNDTLIAPDAKINDGFFNLVMIEKLNFFKYPIIALKLMKGTINTAKEVTHFVAKEATINSASNLWHIDGEAVLIESPVQIKVLPLSLLILSR